VAPPEKLTIDTPEQIALEFTLASVGSRFLALGIDTVVQVAAFGAFAAAAFGLMVMLPSPASAARPWIFGGLVLCGFTIYYGYFALFEALWQGQTPGKRVIGLRTIHATGRPITVFEAILRNILRVADQLPFVYAVGILTMLLTERSQRLGDLAAGSVVVHEQRTERPDFEAHQGGSAARYGAGRLTVEEIALVETFLRRRRDLEGVRELRGRQIAERIRERLGAAGDEDDERFLEGIVAEYRSTSRYL
jgi:uncharacterized RDD family membrane protein YckC